MICSCRLTPSRLFIRSFAQSYLPQPLVPPPRPLPRRQQALRIRQAGFCTTRPAYDASPESRPTDQPNGDFEGRLAESGGGGREYPEVGEKKEKKNKDEGRSPRKTDRKATTDTITQNTNESRARRHDASSQPPKRQSWQAQKSALREKFPEGWKPLKRLSPDAVAGIRALHAQLPEEYTTAKLAQEFEVSAEAIRRILKSKWTPSAEEEEKRQERWFRRGVSVWERYAEQGKKPPQRWRREGVARDPSWHDKRQAAIAKRMEEEAEERREAQTAGSRGRGIF